MKPTPGRWGPVHPTSSNTWYGTPLVIMVKRWVGRCTAIHSALQQSRWDKNQFAIPRHKLHISSYAPHCDQTRTLISSLSIMTKRTNTVAYLGGCRVQVAAGYTHHGQNREKRIDDLLDLPGIFHILNFHAHRIRKLSFYFF